MDRMDVQPLLPVKVSVTIDTMLNFDHDFDGHGDGDVKCKQTFMGGFGITIFEQMESCLDFLTGPWGTSQEKVNWCM